MADTKKVIEIIDAVCGKIEEKKDYLTELDRPIGDSDHGINLSRGFGEVEKKLPSLKDRDIGTVLKTVGMTLMSKVGGASGPLYGSFYMKMGQALNGKTEMDVNDFLTAFSAGIDGVQKLGKAQPEEATMIDAMLPARDAIRASLQTGADAKAAITAGCDAAWKGVEHTKELVATKGRASYVGARGIGHEDPGAASFSCMLEAVRDHL